MGETQERILYVVKDDGTEEAARHFDQLADAMARTEKLQAAMNSAQQMTAQNARIAAYKAEAAALNEKAGAADNASVQLKTMNMSAGAAALTTGQLREKISAAGGAIGGVTAQLSGAIPALDGFSGGMGRIIQTVPQILGMLGGGGATAIVGGGLIAAVALLGKTFSESAERAKELEEANKRVKEAGEAVADYNRRLDAAYRTRRLQDAIDNKAGVEEAAAFEARQKKKLELEIEAAAAGGQSVRSLDLGAPEGPAAAKKKSDEMALFYQREMENKAIIARIDEAQANRRTEVREQEYARNMEIHEYSINANAELDDFERTLREKRYAAQEQEWALRDKAFAKEKSQREAMGKTIQSVAAIGLNATSRLIVAASQGQAVSTKAVLATIGESMVAEGTKAIFSGIIDVASFNYASGAVKIATGGAEIAAGFGLGAASRGGGAPAAAAAPVPNQPYNGPGGPNDVSPYRSDGSSGGGSVTNVTYVEFSSLTGPTAEDGLKVREALGRADNSYGAKV